MSKRDLFRTISLIDDDIAAEAGASKKAYKIHRIKKAVLIAAIIVVLSNVTALAANFVAVSRSSHSSVPTYKKTPATEVLERDIGIPVNIKNSFDNGYTFKRAYITENEDVFDNNEKNEYSGLVCKYVKDGEELSVSVEPQTFETERTDALDSLIYKDCELIYYSYQNKIVPPDYKMSEQDKEDEKAGKYVFSWGSDEVTIADVQIVTWAYNGVNFGITDISSAVSKDEIMEMAKELIDWQGNISEK